MDQSLPGSAYTTAEAFAAERERVFFRQWFVVGRQEQVAEPGAYLVADVAGEQVIIVRTGNGTLTGHYNVCRHRGRRSQPRGLGDVDLTPVRLDRPALLDRSGQQSRPHWVV